MTSKRIAVATFVLAAIVRLIVFALSPHQTNTIDAQIYQGGGQLIVRGINPYDYEDGIEARQRLQTELKSREPHTEWGVNQSMWNRYASENLPMSLFLYGMIESVSTSLTAYRLTFLFLDSILSAMICWLVLTRLPNMRRSAQIFIALALGALSPVLIKFGTWQPEDKGFQILLMVWTVLCFTSKNARIFSVAGPIALGLSIAFKGLGIFLVPWVIVKIVHNYWLRPTTWNHDRRPIPVYASVLLGILSAGIWFVPFWPEVKTMMLTRIDNNTNIPPQYGSIWRPLGEIFPSTWMNLREWAIWILGSSVLIGIIRGRLASAGLSAALLMIFTVLMLVAGSLDRQNIALTMAILLLLTEAPWMGLILTGYYVLFGAAMLWINTMWLKLWVLPPEVDDAWFIAGFAALTICLYVFQAVSKSRSSDPTSIVNQNK